MVFCASALNADGKIVSTGLFMAEPKSKSLKALVRKKAREIGGTGEIWWNDLLVYRCNARGKKTAGTW